MDFLQAIILGIVEGISEFLPISSTGHLILTARLLGIDQTEFVKTFEIAIQSGAILSVIVLYGKTMFKNIELLKRVAVAFIPTAIVGFILYKLIKQFLLGNEMVVLAALLIGGIALILVEIFFKKRKNNDEQQAITETSKMSYKNAAIIGLFQSIAVIPGVSRSASSIVGAMLLGMSREAAVEFSFLLAIPTILAATALDLKETSFSFSSNEWTLLAIGFTVSFISALVAIKWFIKFVQTNTFIPFGIYRIILAILYFFIILNPLF